MSQYVYAVGGALADGKRYYAGNMEMSFASPMKELSQKTVLTEDSKVNSNDSYRQHTKYNDSVDSYYSTYDLGILLHNEESYLEGTIDGEQDADYYSFSYQQKKFYSQMHIASEVEILLECKDSDCSLTVYDSYGNQVGMAEDDGNGNKKLVLPDWDCVTSKYIIRVEGAGDESDGGKGTYRIKIMESKSRDIQSSSVQHSDEIRNAGNSQNQDEVRQKWEKSYKNRVEQLHKMQFELLPESEKYEGTDTVNELLDRMKKGEQLDEKELTYVKIFANLADYEKAEAAHYIQNTFYQKIKETAEQNGVELPAGLWEIEVNAVGNVVVKGDMAEENRKELEDILSENFADDLWKYHLQASDISSARYRLLNGYYELEQFIRKATGGQYSYKDVTIDENGKVGGLPDKMCQLINSQDANARYEELRDDIYLLMDCKNTYGLENITGFQVKFQVSDSRFEAVSPSVGMEQMGGIGYYKSMKPIK